MIINRVKNYIKNSLLSAIAHHPFLLKKVYGSRQKYRTLVVNKNTNIVIEGFPRSANSYAVLIFENTQTEKINIAHHLHAPAQFVLAKKFEVPAIALIREPLEAISSLLLRDKSLTIKQGIQRYIDFYQVVLELKDSVVIASFETVINDFSIVVERCNQKFASEFIVSKNSEVDETKVFEQIERINRQQEQGDLSMLAMPHHNKVLLKANMKDELQDHHLMDKATTIFESVIKYSC